MIRATLTMKVKVGREADFEQVWRSVAEHTRLAPGNLRQALLRDAEDPGLFVITSDWESREAFTRFERSDEQDRLTAPLREMRESVRMTVYQLVAAL
jgi:heme-degrading monooxygenase HmoA